MLKSLEKLRRTREECLEGLEQKGNLVFLQRIDTSIYRQKRVIETKGERENVCKSTRHPRASMGHCRGYKENIEGEACEIKSHKA